MSWVRFRIVFGICWVLGLVVVGVWMFGDLISGCNSQKYDSGSCSLGLLFTPFYVLFWGSALGIALGTAATIGWVLWDLARTLPYRTLRKRRNRSQE